MVSHYVMVFHYVMVSHYVMVNVRNDPLLQHKGFQIQLALVKYIYHVHFRSFDLFGGEVKVIFYRLCMIVSQVIISSNNCVPYST